MGFEEVQDFVEEGFGGEVEFLEDEIFGGHGGFVGFLGGGFNYGDFVGGEVVELVNVLIDRGF